MLNLDQCLQKYQPIYYFSQMGQKYIFHQHDQLYFVSFATVNWIDVFVRRIYCDIVVDSLKYCIENKGLELYAWVIMSNHVHLIMSTKDGNLSNIMRDLKRHTSKTILKAIEENAQESRREWMLYMFGRAGQYNSNNEQYQFWQQSNHPVELSTYQMLQQRLDYLHNNPVKSGAVEYPHEYLYSSAKDYYTEQKGLLPVILLS
jgi:putative transposase